MLEREDQVEWAWSILPRRRMAGLEEDIVGCFCVGLDGLVFSFFADYSQVRIWMAEIWECPDFVVSCRCQWQSQQRSEVNFRFRPLDRVLRRGLSSAMRSCPPRSTRFQIGRVLVVVDVVVKQYSIRDVPSRLADDGENCDTASLLRPDIDFCYRRLRLIDYR